MKVQYAVQNAATGSLMGRPNEVLDNLVAAMASYTWLSQEQERKRAEYQEDPENEAKAESWSRVVDHRYRVVCRQVSPWEVVDVSR